VTCGTVHEKPAVVEIHPGPVILRLINRMLAWEAFRVGPSQKLQPVTFLLRLGLVFWGGRNPPIISSNKFDFY